MTYKICNEQIDGLPFGRAFSTLFSQLPMVRPFRKEKRFFASGMLVQWQCAYFVGAV